AVEVGLVVTLSWLSLLDPQGSLAMLIDGAECSHHSECHSDCCLIDFDNGGAFCAPKAGYTMMCLPQTKGATNIICPCRLGLSC
uniref:Colipase like 2 n=1 Tax=Loxodonta africana TaxID=9785 RepID=G3SLR7_LOXAF